ncbi:hypothetical protein HMPREF9374_3052 [Desmospora sp. 8437]|nr:hypothetical protein HMPREF9374_3052 [Desmospora sp. 8437]
MSTSSVQVLILFGFSAAESFYLRRVWGRRNVYGSITKRYNSLTKGA